MIPPDSERHTFIVRFWRQSREIEDEPPAWRGMIEDVSKGQHRYFLTFQEMLLFMIEGMRLQAGDLQALIRNLQPPEGGADDLG
jgi:hypothetical protein